MTPEHITACLLTKQRCPAYHRDRQTDFADSNLQPNSIAINAKEQVRQPCKAQHENIQGAACILSSEALCNTGTAQEQSSNEEPADLIDDGMSAWHMPSMASTQSMPDAQSHAAKMLNANTRGR